MSLQLVIYAGWYLDYALVLIILIEPSFMSEGKAT